MKITDEMLRAGVKAMNTRNHIQGFSTLQTVGRDRWGPPHYILDVARQQELWRGNSHSEMMMRIDMERFRLGLEAALSQSGIES